jgi:hypothetical protein
MGNFEDLCAWPPAHLKALLLLGQRLSEAEETKLFELNQEFHEMMSMIDVRQWTAKYKITVLLRSLPNIRTKEQVLRLDDILIH